MKSIESDASGNVLEGRKRFDAAASLAQPESSSRHNSAVCPIDTYPQDSLQRLTDRLRESLRCDAVAIRLMGRNKELCYAASSGRTFAPDIISSHDHSGRPHCVCDQVCTADFDRDLACFTNDGSFVVNSLTDSLALRRRASAPRFAHLLNGQAEFQSLVVAPIRAAGVALGVIQCADARPNHFDANAVQLIESVVAELAQDIYYDSLWPPRSWATVMSDEPVTIVCPICGRERDHNGIWHTATDKWNRHLSSHGGRQVVCPSCLRLCNFE